MNRSKFKSKSISLLLIFTFLIQFSSMQQFFLNQPLTVEDNYINENLPGSSENLPYDNQTHRYIFLFNSSINLIDNSSLFSYFSLKGGVLSSDPWNYMYGFNGIINNSETDLGAFITQYNPLVFQDNIIEGQMNSVHEQINTYPAVIDDSGYGYLGDLNSSIAFLDTGIDESHTLINQSNIIAW